MGDVGDTFKAYRGHTKALRAKYGVACPVCPVKRPKASPTILMPGQRCRVDRWLDPRPPLTDEQQRNAA